MHIDYFREHQNDVFIPALAFVLVAAILISLPILFAPTLARRGRLRATGTLCVTIAVVALIGATIAALPGFSTLQEQRRALQVDLHDRYGIDVPIGDAGKLLNGDTFVLPAAHVAQKVHLQATGGDDYILVHAPKSAGDSLELPHA